MPSAESQPVPFTLNWQGKDYRFLTDSGVFSKGELDFGTRVLLRALPGEIRGRVLDLGCGWGAVGVLVGAENPDAQVFMADINERAVALARENARINGVTAQVGQSDGFERIQGAFDLIALNPPIRAGKRVVYGLFSDCAAHLAPGGALYVVIRRQQGADSAAKFLKTIFESVETVNKKGGYHVFRCEGGRQDAV